VAGVRRGVMSAWGRHAQRVTRGEPGAQWAKCFDFSPATHWSSRASVLLPKDPWLNGLTTHERKVGTGLADVLEACNFLIVQQHGPGMRGVIGWLDAEVRCLVGRVSVPCISGSPVDDAQDAGAEDRHEPQHVPS